MSYQVLDHMTDAIIKVTASSLEEAFTVAAIAVVDTTLDIKSVSNCQKKKIIAKGKDLDYLLYSWLEEIIFELITRGFAICKFDVKIIKNSQYEIHADIFGEEIDLNKHRFKVEIKAPTFHEMEIKQEEKIQIKFLLDL